MSLQEVLKRVPKDEVLKEEMVEELAKCFLGMSNFDSSRCSLAWRDAIWSVLYTAVREGWSPSDLQQKLDGLVGANIAEALGSCLKVYGSQLKSMVSSVRWDHPSVVDVEWSVSKGLESPDLVRVGIPSTTVTLHTVPAGQTASSTVLFDCDPYQLQDLHWKVKEALNAYNQLKRNN